MALHSVRAIIDPSPKDVHVGIAHNLNLVSLAFPNLQTTGSSESQTFLVMLEHGLRLQDQLVPPKPYLVIQTEPNFNSIIDHLWAQLQLKVGTAVTELRML